MSWNYRVVHRVVTVGPIVGETFSIHEVYYDADGKPNGVSELPTYLSGESIQDINDDIALIRGATKRPVIEWDSLVVPSAREGEAG